MQRAKLKPMTTPARALMSVFLFSVCLFYFVLLLWTFLNSMKGFIEYNQDRVSLPKDWLISNFKLAWETLSAGGKSIPRMIFNALWLSVGGIVISQSCILCFAYVMARYNFPLKKLFNGLNMVIIMVPVIGSLPSFMKMILRLGMYNSPLYLLVHIGGFGGAMIIYRTAFRNIPWEFAEAGFIDGANHFQVFSRLMLPQIKPLIIAQSIGVFINIWNDAMTPLLYLPDYPTLSSGLYVYQIEMERKINTPLLFAGCILCAIPPLIMFICFRKYMMEVDLSGGIKG